jgi:ATP-dependent DNA helicase DinG
MLTRCYQALWQAYTEASGTGIRDNWPKPIPDPCWDRIAADRHTCNKALSHHQHCPFHRARNDMDAADVLVVNHALLLSDLTMGAASYCRRRTSVSMCWTRPITCPPSPGITAPPRQHQGSRRWLEKLVQSAGKLARTLNKESLLDPQLKLQDALASLQPDLKALEQWLAANDHLFGGEPHHRFADGVLPDPCPCWRKTSRRRARRHCGRWTECRAPSARR